ncbi:MAG: 4Fe-4S cluster-binding domain-containing protein [Lachnospiraceae bacterium]|nr:4Fe-4S cluster-binding domain-containing protein [Lachnospiraceae bacterium]
MKISDSKKRTIILTLTRQCNLACTYCFEHNKSSECMDVCTAMEIIKKEYKELQQDEILEVDFFGGEPFLTFNVLRKIVEEVEDSYMRDDILFFVDTNGTLINDEIKEWLCSHSQILVCGLSYDGTPHMQDMNRSGSSFCIDLDFFKEIYPYQTIKMTVSKETLPYLAEGVEYLENKGFEVACNLAYGIDWSAESFYEMLEQELLKLINRYLKNPDITPCSILNTSILPIAMGEKEKRRFCGAGINMVSYDVDGKTYPCQLFMPISVGKKKARESQDIIFYEKIPNNLLDEKCCGCVIKSVCPTCYGANYQEFGNIYWQNESYCKLQKIIFKAISFFKGMQWEKNRYMFLKRKKHYY